MTTRDTAKAECRTTESREARLARALRDNLRRRKAQARAGEPDAPPEE